MPSQSDKSGLDNNNAESYKADRGSQKQQENDSSKKAAGVAAKGAINYFTGGQGGKVYDAAKKLPVVGKKLDKAEEKLGKAANKATGGKFGKAAKKMDDAGALDAADKALSLNTGNPNGGAPNSGASPNNPSGSGGNNAMPNASNGLGKGGFGLPKFPGLGGKKDNKESEESSEDEENSSKSNKGTDLIGKAFGSGFFKNIKVKIIIGVVIFVFFLLLGIIISASEEGAKGKSEEENGTTCQSSTKILDIALGEVGNNEANGTHAKYLAMFGFGPSTAWCAAFVSWCAKEAGIDESVIPHTAAVSVFLEYFKKIGTFQSITSNYKPSPGDLIIWKAHGRSHIGIVKEFDEATGILTTVEGNSSNAVRINTYQYSNLEAGGVVGFASQECTDTSDGDNATDIQNGDTVILPKNLGPVATREFDLAKTNEEINHSREMMRCCRKITNPYAFPENSSQRVVQNRWIKEGAQHDSKGFCKLQGRYIVATTTTFGKAGDKVDFYMSSGKIIHVIIGDTKSPNDDGCTKWGHQYGKNVLEFMGKNSIGNNPYYTLGLNGQSVIKAVKGGSIFK